jgi:predicted aldo/keto reductase-like oxidoreductase
MWDHLEKLEVSDFLDKAKADGRIVNAGFSFHGSGADFKPIMDSYNWDFCQVQYNFLDEKNQAGTVGLEYAASKGLGVIIMEPLRGGNLVSPMPSAVKDIWDEAPVQRTAAAWGLRWVWNHPEVTVVLSGMNDEIHIQENLTTADEAYPNSLTEAELQLVKKVEQKYRELMKAGCTGCRYCMPCQQGVNIPVCFEFYNKFYMSNNPGAAKFFYTLQLSGIPGIIKPGFASQCVQCGECLEKCPQKLEIPTLLKAVVKEFEGPELEKMLQHRFSSSVYVP